MIARLHDKQTRARLIREIAADSRDWENIYLVAVGQVDFDRVGCKSRPGALARQTPVGDRDRAKKEPLDALLDFIIADHGQTGAIFFMMSESDMKAALKSPFVSICTIMARGPPTARWLDQIASARMGNLPASSRSLRARRAFDAVGIRDS